MHIYSLTTLASVFAAAGILTQGAAALGVNCRGSGLCGTCSPRALSDINGLVQQFVSDDTVFSNGQHIACSGHCCAFLQNVSGTKTGAQVKTFLQELLAHGCAVCGSQPTEPGNDVSTGQLTVNFVSSP